jgi:hypothetical protein
LIFARDRRSFARESQVANFQFPLCVAETSFLLIA